MDVSKEYIYEVVEGLITLVIFAVAASFFIGGVALVAESYVVMERIGHANLFDQATHQDTYSQMQRQFIEGAIIIAIGIIGIIFASVIEVQS